MITIANKTAVNTAQYTDEQVNAKFLELMPTIRMIARYAFKDYDHDRRDEAVQSVLVGAFINIKQLAEKGRLEDAYATPIAWFSISAIRTGRTPGVPQNSKDVMNSRCQFLGRAKVKNYGLAENITDSFESEATAADARYPVPKQIAFKMDFMESWYANQTDRDREIIKDLAMGEATGETARKFGLSPASISQYRKRYEKSWYAFINPVEETDFVEELRELAAELEKAPAN